MPGSGGLGVSCPWHSRAAGAALLAGPLLWRRADAHGVARRRSGPGLQGGAGDRAGCTAGYPVPGITAVVW